MSYAFDVAANNAGVGNVITMAPTAGSTIVVFSVTSSGGGSPTVALSDNIGGDTWVVPANNISSASWQVCIGYVLNCPAGITSITGTYNGGTPGSIWLAAASYKSMPATAAFIGITTMNEQVAPGTGANLITSSALNITSQPALFVGLTLDNQQNGGTTAGTGFTLRVNGPSSSGQFIEDKEITSTGNTSATFTSATHGADTFDTWAIGFTEPSSGGSVPAPMYHRKNVLYFI